LKARNNDVQTFSSGPGALLFLAISSAMTSLTTLRISHLGVVLRTVGLASLVFLFILAVTYELDAFLADARLVFLARRLVFRLFGFALFPFDMVFLLAH
jgi:hypothetical protein